MNKYICSAATDIGCERENQEDYVSYRELDDENLFCVIADGTGSRAERLQPAPVIVEEINEYVEKLFSDKKDVFLDDPCYYMKVAMIQANRVISALKLGNEELYSGYAASVTCILLSSDLQIYFTHAGNTRLYVMRDGRLVRMTEDDTKAAKLLADGTIDMETYHVHPDRLRMTSGVGVVLDPDIQIRHGRLKENDLVLLTTDGIHYAINQESMEQIILESQNVVNATSNLISAAKNIVKYPDNMAAIIIHREEYQ